MSPAHAEWIAAYVARYGGNVTAMCQGASAEMVAAFPELRRVRGFDLWCGEARRERSGHRDRARDRRAVSAEGSWQSNEGGVMEEAVFPAFQKIPRLNRACVVTEKIDGTNALIAIDEAGVIRAGSRSRWITPESDNYGFARWVAENESELRRLGPGLHYGEWWGAGIQRRYGLDHKRFSLFNTSRWTPETLPACCHVVPVLAESNDIRAAVDDGLRILRERGSIAAAFFPRPEGVVVYQSASRSLYKVLLEGDEIAKGESCTA